jgi:hypothetical protein
VLARGRCSCARIRLTKLATAATHRPRDPEEAVADDDGPLPRCARSGGRPTFALPRFRQNYALVAQLNCQGCSSMACLQLVQRPCAFTVAGSKTLSSRRRSSQVVRASIEDGPGAQLVGGAALGTARRGGFAPAAPTRTPQRPLPDSQASNVKTALRNCLMGAAAAAMVALPAAMPDQVRPPARRRALRCAARTHCAAGALLPRRCRSATHRLPLRRPLRSRRPLTPDPAAPPLLASPQLAPAAQAGLQATDPVKNASALLRYALPIDNKNPIRRVQRDLESISESLRIPGSKSLTGPVARSVRSAGAVLEREGAAIEKAFAPGKEAEGRAAIAALKQVRMSACCVGGVVCEGVGSTCMGHCARCRCTLSARAAAWPWPWPAPAALTSTGPTNEAAPPLPRHAYSCPRALISTNPGHPFLPCSRWQSLP